MRVVGRGASVMFSVLQADHRRRPARRTCPSSSRPSAAWSAAFASAPSGSTSCSPTPQTSFLVVCGPQGEPIDEAVYFHRKLVEAQLPFGGVIVNKVHYEGEPPRRRRATRRAARRTRSATRTSARRVADNFADYRALAERDARNIERLGAPSCARERVIEVPYLDEDVHDLARAGRDQPLPVRDQRRRAPGDRRRPSDRRNRPEPPGVVPGDSTCSSWGDRRKFSTAGRPGARRERS